MSGVLNRPDGPLPTVPYGRGGRLTAMTVSHDVWAPYNVMDGVAESLRGGMAYDANTATFTVPIAGLYRVEGRILFDQNATGFRGVGALLNDTFPLYSLANAGSQIATAVLSDTIYLPAGGTIAPLCFQNSGTALAVNNNSTGWNAFSVTYAGGA